MSIDIEKTKKYFQAKKHSEYFYNKNTKTISKEKQLAKKIANPLFGYFADKLVNTLIRR